MPQSVTFDRAADYYDQTRAFPPGVEARAAEIIARAGRLGRGDRVLEVGVGTGRIALPLVRHVGLIVGVDLARPMMHRLQEKRREERVSAVEGDATRLPLATAGFDAAVAVHVFHLIPDWSAAVREVARVLKPGRPLVHGWSENFHKESWWDTWNRAIPGQQPEQTGVQFSQHRTFLLEAGWRPAGEEQRVPYSYRLSPAAFLEQLEKRVWSATWPLSDDELARGVAEVREAMLKEHGSLESQVEVEVGFYAQAYLPPASNTV